MEKELEQAFENYNQSLRELRDAVHDMHVEIQDKFGHIQNALVDILEEINNKEVEPWKDAMK